jgi:hypothetical protein
MKNKLQKQLLEKYPKILKHVGGDPRQTCMAWGIETGDGWYDLLDRAMQKIQDYCDSLSKDGREVQLVASQIKSKFGTLRFYVDFNGDITEEEQDELYKFVNEAEDESETSCEICGKCAKTGRNSMNWIETVCPDHSCVNFYEEDQVEPQTDENK